MQERSWRTITLVCFVLILIGGTLANARMWQAKTRGEDVYWSWLEGQRLLKGVNPYERTLTGNLRDNDKYATYFPIFYYGTALSIFAGLGEYEEWLESWRVLSLLANLGIAAILFYLPFRRKVWALALFAAGFWLFNRWTLHVTRIAHLDFLAILPLLASLALISRRPYAAFLLLGFSISIKQIGLFLIPLYLIWIWQESSPDRIKRILIAVALIAIVPFVTSLPFLIWNPAAYLISVIFDALRNPADHFGAASVDAMIGWVGLPAKIPMLALMLLAFVLAWQRRVGRWTAVLLVMAAFVDFSSVLFRQYFTWLVPFIPLAVLDLLRDAPAEGQPIQPLTEPQ
jgi:uncharacterized membrane protein